MRKRRKGSKSEINPTGERPQLHPSHPSHANLWGKMTAKMSTLVAPARSGHSANKLQRSQSSSAGR
jgi:hypothetical protein